MIAIKAITQLDINALRRIISGYVSDMKYVLRRVESETETVFTLELVALDKPYIKQYDHLDDETLKSYQDALEAGFTLGAYDGAELAGIAVTMPEHWNSSLWVREFHVAEGYRGRGIGHALMEALIEKGRGAQFRVIVCETQTTNVPAIRFYRRLGFTFDGFDLSYYSNDDWPDGEVAVFMKRRLDK